MNEFCAFGLQGVKRPDESGGETDLQEESKNKITVKLRIYQIYTNEIFVTET